MADNVPITAGSGTSIATDDVGGVHYQKIKLAFGDADTATLVSGSDPLPISGTVNVNGTVPVSGTFFQVTQPVSIAATVAVSGPLTDTQLRASAVPISGTVTANLGTIAGVATETTLAAINTKTLAAGQAVMASSSPVVIASNQSAIAVSFTQQALPANQSVNVSQLAGTAADVNSGVKSAGTLRVVLATDQPALTNKLLVTPDSVALPANQSVNVSQMNGVAPTMGSGVTGTGVQRVVLATDVALPTGANVIGALTANQSVNNAQVAGTATSTGNGVVGAGVQRVAIASDNSAFGVNATGPTLTKATQGATGFSVQNLKDAGRSLIAMTAEFAFAQTAETILTMTVSVDGAATSTFTSRAVANGKTMRFQHIVLEVETLGSGTAPQRAYLRLRRNNAGATIASSNLQGIWTCVSSAAIVKSGCTMSFDIPDGLEIVGDGTKTFGFTLETPDWVATTATGRAKITVVGFEY